jgi:hypothetical protein
VASHYRFVIAGPLPFVVEAQIRNRFGEVELVHTAAFTILRDVAVDQAGLRALLTLLWDGGIEVLDVEAVPGREAQGRR